MKRDYSRIDELNKAALLSGKSSDWAVGRSMAFTVNDYSLAYRTLKRVAEVGYITIFQDALDGYAYQKDIFQAAKALQEGKAVAI